jgi:ankyrin repeat protein
MTPASEMTVREKTESVRKLLETGADPNEVHPYVGEGLEGHTPILIASRNGYTEIARMLLKAGADITIVGGQMLANPAHKAAYMGHPEMMRLLAEHKDFSKIKNAQGPLNGYTPLMDAVWHGHFETAQILLESGADRNLRSWDGKTALDLARKFKYEKIVKLLSD